MRPLDPIVTEPGRWQAACVDKAGTCLVIGTYASHAEAAAVAQAVAAISSKAESPAGSSSYTRGAYKRYARTVKPYRKQTGATRTGNPIYAYQGRWADADGQYHRAGPWTPSKSAATLNADERVREAASEASDPAPSMPLLSSYTVETWPADVSEDTKRTHVDASGR